MRVEFCIFYARLTINHILVSAWQSLILHYQLAFIQISSPRRKGRKTEVGIYKRKQEYAFEQESEQEK